MIYLHQSRFLFSVTLVSFLWASVLNADDKEIRHKARDLDKVKAELNRKKEEKERLEREAEDLSNAVKRSHKRIKNVEESLTYTLKRNSDVGQQVATMKNKSDNLAADVRQSSLDFQNSTQRYYVACLVSGVDAPAPVYGRYALQHRALELKKLKTNQAEARESLDNLVETELVLRNEVQKQQSQLKQIKNGLQTKEKLLSKTMTRSEILEAELKELQKTSRELAALIDNLRTSAKQEREAEKKARAAKQTSGASPIMTRSLPWPVRGRVVTRYGRQTHPALGTPFISNGIVIGLDESKPVTAVEAGKILFAGDFMSYGSMVVVEHEGDWFTVYGRLSRWLVEKGQELRKGDVIGFPRPAEGGGLESYFELRFYGKPTDPMPWLVQ